MKITKNPISEIYAAFERIAPCRIDLELLNDGRQLDVSSDDMAPWYTFGFKSSYKVYHLSFQVGILTNDLTVNAYTAYGVKLLEEIEGLLDFEIEATMQPPKRSEYIGVGP